MTDQQRPHQADEDSDAVPASGAPETAADGGPRDSADQPTAALPAVPPGAPPDAPAAAPFRAEPPYDGGDPPAPPGGGEPPQSPESQSYQRWVIGGLIAFLLFITIIALLFLVDGDDDGVAEATATSALPTATTVAVAATETPTAEAPTETPVEPTATTEPTPEPTATTEPTAEPTATTEPTAEPTATTEPTTEPTAEPTPSPTPGPPTPTPEPEPTATEDPSAPVPAQGTLAYSANWSGGAGDWQLGDGWSVSGGSLIADGTADAPLVAPFALTSADYAIEARMVIRASNSCDEAAGVLARADVPDDVNADAFDGYAGVVCAHEWQIASIDGGAFSALENGYRPLDEGAHTYRLEVAGERLRLFIDGRFYGAANDSRLAEAGSAGLVVSGGVDVTVESFSIYVIEAEG